MLWKCGVCISVAKMGVCVVEMGYVLWKCGVCISVAKMGVGVVEMWGIYISYKMGECSDLLETGGMYCRNGGYVLWICISCRNGGMCCRNGG